MNPLTEEVANDGLRRRPDYIRLFEFLAARDGHHRQFRGEALHVFGLLLQEALRDQERKVAILVAGGFKSVIEFPLQQLPHGIAVRLNHHAAFDDFGGLRHVALQNNILVPRGKVLAAGRDWRFSHN